MRRLLMMFGTQRPFNLDLVQGATTAAVGLFMVAFPRLIRERDAFDWLDDWNLMEFGGIVLLLGAGQFAAPLVQRMWHQAVWMRRILAALLAALYLSLAAGVAEFEPSLSMILYASMFGAQLHILARAD